MVPPSPHYTALNFLVEVTDFGFELTTCRFGSVRVSRWGIGTAPKPL